MCGSCALIITAAKLGLPKVYLASRISQRIQEWVPTVATPTAEREMRNCINLVEDANQNIHTLNLSNRHV
jgi:hypothetical protein